MKICNYGKFELFLYLFYVIFFADYDGPNFIFLGRGHKKIDCLFDNRKQAITHKLDIGEN